MTIPIIYRILAFLVVAIAVTGGALLVRSSGDAPQDDAPVVEAADLAALEARVADLEGQIESSESSSDRLAEQVASLGRRLERQVADLRASMKDLRGAVRQARSGASSALEQADAASARAERAIARAEELARDLRVLEDRFNVHMKRNHGGG